MGDYIYTLGALIAYLKTRFFWFFCLILLIYHYASYHLVCKLQKHLFLLCSLSTNKIFIPWYKDYQTAYKTPIILKICYLPCWLHYLLLFLLQIDLCLALIIISSDTYYFIIFHSKFPFHVCPSHAYIHIC